MRISDWSSDVCSSELPAVAGRNLLAGHDRLTTHAVYDRERVVERDLRDGDGGSLVGPGDAVYRQVVELFTVGFGDRKSVVSGKSVAVRLDLGGRRIIKKKITDKFSTL